MQYVMFTKHLEGYTVAEIIAGIKRVGIDGADLCVRPGYPVNPENCRSELPATAKRFADDGLGIAVITSPGDFTDASADHAEDMFAARAEAGVPAIKLGYWHWKPGTSYWTLLDECRKKLEGLAALAEKHGVKALVHNHSGNSMGCNSSAARNVVNGFDPQHVGIFADVGHLALVGETLAMALDIAWDYIHLFALKDLLWVSELGKLDAKRATKVVPFGHGFVEWGTFVAELKARGYDGALSFHCEYGGYPPESILDQAAIDVRFFRECWDKTEAR
jgi:sugar phosphate isomerase/epimerase